MTQQTVDVAVIGGGAAGLAAAIEARRAGAPTVWILERSEALGGVLPQCIHTGFGLHYFGENLSGPEYIARFIQKAQAVGVNWKLKTMALAVTPDRRIVAVNSEDGPLHLHPKAIVLAMGCRERPRGALRLPSTRPAGIFTAGTAQRLLDVEGYLPGKRVVLLGSGDVGLIVARRLTLEGVTVVAVLEIQPYPGGLRRNLVQCVEDFGTPLLLNHTITHIHGRDRVEGVTIAHVDGRQRPIPQTAKRLACDTLIVSAGLIPENELSKDAGLLLDAHTGGPVVDEGMETSVNGVFACGNVVHVHDLVDHVTWSGEIAGRSAARHAGDRKPESTRRIHVRAGANVRYVVPQVISGATPVTLFLRVKRPMRRVAVHIGDAITVTRRVVTPPELLVLTLPGGQRLPRDQLTVSVKRRENHADAS